VGSTWVKLADTFPYHPKVLAVGPEAGWLYVCGLCHCSAHLTDGFIAASAMPHLTPLKRPERLAARLVAERLWDAVDGGWSVHDYTTQQRTRAEVEHQREQARGRAKKSREVRALMSQRTETERADTSRNQNAETQNADADTSLVPPSDVTPNYALNTGQVVAIRSALRREATP
jgi:hypothetical protein